MDTSSIDIISQRQQARKSYFYEENGDRKTKIPQEKSTTEQSSTPDYKVDISAEAKSAAAAQSTASSSPNSSRLAELRAKSDAVIAARNPAPESKEESTETVTGTPDGATNGATETSVAETAKPAGDFISQRQVSRQEYFNPGESAPEFSYDRNSELDALKAQSDAIMNKYKNPEG